MSVWITAAPYFGVFPFWAFMASHDRTGRKLVILWSRLSSINETLDIPMVSSRRPIEIQTEIQTEIAIERPQKIFSRLHEELDCHRG